MLTACPGVTCGNRGVDPAGIWIVVSDVTTVWIDASATCCPPGCSEDTIRDVETGVATAGLILGNRAPHSRHLHSARMTRAPH